ncbi:MAG TPA: HAMP domain-containing sensor histidine kinase [Gemmatimonadaceae bacterium]|nr:HAMP domain-containing sensor histidine kinase [Gemmatimonadaceae bacterium]
MSAPERGAIRGAAPGEATADAGGASPPLAILAPTGRDGAVAATVLDGAGFSVIVCEDMAALCASIDRDVGVLLVAEEALGRKARDMLLAALERQPSWSDVPVIVLTAESELSRVLSPPLRELAARANVTLLERPVRVATLVTTLRSALRARQRQFDVRDHLVERAENEVALRAAREQAESANRTKGEFLAVMSHELRTPLNAIGGYAELIEMGVRGPITDEQRADLRRIQQSQRHLLGLINQVLNYTRVDTGTVSYDMTDVPVREALAAAEALIVPQLRARELQYTLGACAASVVVHADRDKLQQILLNLLTNAIKFTKPGGELRVACAAHGDTVAISVEDTGIGIAADKLASVFEPFVQVDAKLTRAHEGVGLGLAISRDLARGMGGDLSVRSEVGRGSTFTLTLPAAGGERVSSSEV